MNKYNCYSCKVGAIFQFKTVKNDELFRGLTGKKNLIQSRSHSGAYKQFAGGRTFVNTLLQGFHLSLLKTALRSFSEKDGVENELPDVFGQFA
jgi:hypothetical protein